MQLLKCMGYKILKTHLRYDAVSKLSYFNIILDSLMWLRRWVPGDTPKLVYYQLYTDLTLEGIHKRYCTRRQPKAMGA